MKLSYFHKSFQIFLEKLFILHEKKRIKKWVKHGHVMLRTLLGQNTNLF